MAKGGKRPGAGRPKGARNKRSREKAAAIEASGLTPLDYMVAVMRDGARDVSIRLDAAKSAAPYVHARLASTELTVHNPDDEKTEEELLAEIEELWDQHPQWLERINARQGGKQE